MWILDKLEEWLRKMVLDSFQEFFTTIVSMITGVTDNLSVTPNDTGSMFGSSDVVWSYITQISENAIFPIAGLLLAYTLAKEVIDEIVDKNSFGQFNVTNLMKIVVKMVFSMLLTINALKIVSAIFAIGNVVLSTTQGIITESNLNIADLTTQITTLLSTAEIPDLLNILTSITLAKIVAHVIKIGVVLMVYGRVIQMIMYTTFAPLPFATFSNKDFDLSQNYIKNIAAIALQGFLMLFLLGLYSILLQSQLDALTLDNISGLAGKIYGICGFGVLLVVALGKTGTITKSIMSAH